MKKSEIILLTTMLFTTLFYGETVGLNLAILGASYALLLLFSTRDQHRSRSFLTLFVLTLLSSVAFAWYGDFTSFIALFFSVCLLAFKSKGGSLKSILTLPVFALNFITFFGRFFTFEDWLPKRKTSVSWQKFIALIVIPSVFISVFFGVYAMGSRHFSSIFNDYEFNLNFMEFFLLAFLGFFLAFNFFNLKIYDFIFRSNHDLKNDFLNEDKILKPTYSFLDIDAERKSGLISLIALNILLLIFIVTFNYEQFVELPKTPGQLSSETHERVNAVILSIIMAVFVIMFFFKGTFNFDKKAKPLKIAAQIWIVLNAILILSSALKNTEYISNLGITYKRLGVYAFLTLALIGLILAFYKIEKKKTNAFLFNHMMWYFYGTVLICSFVNWGNIATQYNIHHNKGNYDFLTSFNFNDKTIKEKFPEKEEVKFEYEERHEDSFLSRTLYYETLKFK